MLDRVSFLVVAAVALAMAIAAACGGGRFNSPTNAAGATGTPYVNAWTDLGFSTWSRCDAYGNIVYIRLERIVVVEKGCK